MKSKLTSPCNNFSQIWAFLFLPSYSSSSSFFFFNNSYGSIYKTEFEQAPRDGERQGSLACCSPWDRKESDTTEQQQIDLSFCLYCSPLPMCFIFPCGTTASKSVSLMALALCLSCTVYSRLHLLNKAVHRLLQLSFLRSQLPN